MKCGEYRANIGNMFGFGGPRATPCGRDATRAVRLGEHAVNTVKGWRPLCKIHAGTYPGYNVKSLADAGLVEPQ